MEVIKLHLMRYIHIETFLAEIEHTTFQILRKKAANWMRLGKLIRERKLKEMRN